MCGLMHGWLAGWLDGWMDGWMCTHTRILSHERYKDADSAVAVEAFVSRAD